MSAIPAKTLSVAGGRSSSGHRISSFVRMANAIAILTGKPASFALCCLAVLIWAATGPVFHYSDTWQLIINSGTSIVTFLMVFLIQNTQNREGAALQAKLDELVRATHAASNQLVAAERLPEKEVNEIREEIVSAAGEVRQ